MLRRLTICVMVPVRWIALAIVNVPLILSAQAAGSSPVGVTNPFLNSLSAFAQRAASPADDLDYATELMRMMGPHVSRGNFTQLARRLASADQAARHDSTKYIRETSVATAFNGLMAQVQGRHSTPFRTDAPSVHNLREFLWSISPGLTSVDSHPDSCLPDEAVLLVILLLANNGKVIVVPRSELPPSVETSEHLTFAEMNASARVEKFIVTHSRATNMKLFDKMLDDLGIQQ